MADNKQAQVVTDLRQEGAYKVIYNTCLDYVERFKHKHGFESIDKISQTQFNACLEYINSEYISREYDLRTDSRRYNEYDIDKLGVLYMVYERLCALYDKAITMYAFSFFCGVDYLTLYTFAKEGSYYGRKATPETMALIKRLQSGHEATLRDKLTSGKSNPVGVIALLNHDYGYATQTVRHEIGVAKQDLQAIASAVGVSLEG
jgi:hypothetical protein